MAQNACFWKLTFTGMQSHPFISVSSTAAWEPQWQKYDSEIIWSANDTWPFKKMSTDLWTTGYFNNAFYIAYSKNFLVKFLERRKGILFSWDNYNSKWHVLTVCFCFDKNRLVIRLGLFTGCWAVQLSLLYHGCLFHTLTWTLGFLISATAKFPSMLLKAAFLPVSSICFSLTSYQFY